MDDFKIGSLFLAALFGLPGFLFLQILAKFCFSSARSYGGRSIQILTAFIISTVLIFLFDSFHVKIFFLDFIDTLSFFGFHITEEYRTFFTNIKLNENLFNYIFLNHKPKQLSFLVATIVFSVTIFAVICSLVCAASINILEWYSKTDFADHFSFGFHILQYLVGRGISFATTQGVREKRIRKRLKHSYSDKTSIQLSLTVTKSNFYYAIPINILEVILFLIFLVIVLVVIVIVILFFIIFGAINLFSEGVLWFFHKFLDMIRHPSERIFESHKFGYRSGIPIVEVLVSENRINKGRLVAFQPKNSEELGSITITNVIQYNKDAEQNSFDRNDRKIYEFPNRNSRLTIVSDIIRDVNVSYLKYSDFDWHFRITDANSVVNQLWYLKIILEKHKARFDFGKFQAWIDSKFAPLFFLELLKLIDKSYSYFFYSYKIREMVTQLRRYLRPYRLDLKKNFDSFSPEEKELVKSQKAELAAALWLIRKRFKY